MNKATRGPEPGLLQRHGAQIAQDYAERRHAQPRHQFRWPQRDGQRLDDVVRVALRAMTGERCAYCDGHPIDAVGEDQIDHFQPKSLPEFYALVCTWTNLYLTCSACNKAKRDTWDERLLRPDADDYSFERYFEYRFDTGELHPSGAASAHDQARAARTIEVLQLNRSGACKQRLRTVRQIRHAASAEDRADVAYRYLLPLCLA